MKKYILSFVGVVALATLLYAESTQIKNTGIGYQIGTSASQHVGFYGAAPVVQQNAAAVTTNVASVAVSLTKASKAASTAVTLTKATMSGNFYDANTQLVSITFITNDGAIKTAATDANCSARVMTIDEYLTSISFIAS